LPDARHRAINKTIEAATSAGGGTVRFPSGTYLSFSIHMKSNLTMYLDQGATIVAADPQEAKGNYDMYEPNETSLLYNRDKVILFSEWLEYSVTEVPSLYDEAAKSQNVDINPAKATTGRQRGAKQVRFISKGDGDTSTQQPSLFDFTGKLRRKRQLVVHK
jgi:hypothetical protein